MKIKNNLRLRFVASFCIFALLITSIFALVVFILERKYAHEFFQRRIHSELKHFAESYQQDKQAPLPVSEDIQSYLGTDKMPDYIKESVEGRQDGVYIHDIDRFEFSDRSKRRISRSQKRERPHDLYFGVRTLPDHQKVYIFIDFEFWHQKERELHAHSSGAFVLVAFIAIILGLITANRVINPLNRLMEVVNKSGPDNIPSGFSDAFKNDEFGALAKAFEASLNRVNKFIKREHQFTRDASHELRTPVTVIKGAVELLEMTPACKEEMVDKLVRRIERSTVDMETTIESLLWLARESNAGEPGPPSDLLPLAQKAIEQNRHLILGKPVEIDLQVDESSFVSAPAGVLTIAISNLIRNACQFTVQGKITVTLKKNCIEVSDTGVGIKEDILKDVTKPAVSSPKSDGFGFGLDIVSRLCSRFGWQLKIESVP
ncbi:HAMP domain-containing histidine kinase, partial [bacterium]|nr:HAMP domain-containing histidine kinase [bacterium]